MIYNRISNKDREYLYRQVWMTPMRQLAKEQGISDVALRKRLSKLDIPLPGRGYWAKSAEKRKGIPIPELPAVTRNTSQYVFGYSIEHVDIDSIPDEQLKESTPFMLLTEESAQVINRFCASFEVEKQLRNPTRWVENMIAKLSENRKSEKEEKERHRYSYWYTPRHEQVVPFDVSEACERRVFRIIDTLDKRLYEIEGRICEGEKYTDRGNKLDWRLKIYVPSGCFSMLIKEDGGKLSILFSESCEKAPVVVCSDADENRIEKQLGQTLYNLCLLADKQRAESELIQRQQKRRFEVDEWKRAVAETEQNEVESKSILACFLGKRSEALSYRAFATELETVIRSADGDDDRHLLCELKDWVEELADEEDPLVRSNCSSECRDIWTLAERIESNREKQLLLLDSQPSYSNEELGLDPAGKPHKSSSSYSPVFR